MKDLISHRMGTKPITILDVLVIDDDRRLRELYEEVLRIFGFRYVYLAEDGAAGAELIKSRHFDLIICDWEMPYMTGDELLKFVRRSHHSPYPQIPIIFSTGKAELQHVEDARDNGVTEFLAKPFTIDGLRRRIIKVFENPRSFISYDNYVGPCRRTRKMLPPNKIERRRLAA